VLTLDIYSKLKKQYNFLFQKINFNNQTTHKKTKRGHLQGTFVPKNKNKFIIIKNKQNGGKIKYRSSWELKFLQWCDQNPNIKKVISEGIKIPYIDIDNKKKNYYPDFVLLYKNEKFLIEIKPNNQIMNETNQRKFQAAKKFANEKGLKFLILTENELKKLISTK
jgi:hypothetical protein